LFIIFLKNFYHFLISIACFYLTFLWPLNWGWVVNSPPEQF
jgi:hypothetical protein